MSRSVDCFEIAGHKRSRIVCEASRKGLAAAGFVPQQLWEHEYRAPVGDLALFYGLTGRNIQMFDDYRNGRKVIYADLGYFGRRDGGRWSGYHKLAINDRHPFYYKNRAHDGRRFHALRVPVLPWRDGRSVIVVGMSDKGAIAEGYRPNEWERWAIAEVRKHTDRPIIYRPKPSWKGAAALPGAEYQLNVPLSKALMSAHAVVCHHSNVAVEAIVSGVPAFVWGGVAKDMGLQDLSKIETPYRPEGRDEWCFALAWCQWSIAELETTAPWLYLKTEGLI